MAENAPSRTFDTGKQLGWLFAATNRTVFTLPKLRKEVIAFRDESYAYLKEFHAGAPYLDKDAMRHAYVSAKMTQKYGQDYVTYLGYCNESVRDITLTNNPLDRGMDLYNNKVGSDMALKHQGLSDKALLDVLWAALENGTLIRTLDDPRVHTRTYLDDGHIAGPAFENTKLAADTIKNLNPFKKTPATVIQTKETVVTPPAAAPAKDRY